MSEADTTGATVALRMSEYEVGPGLEQSDRLGVKLPALATTLGIGGGRHGGTVRPR